MTQRIKLALAQMGLLLLVLFLTFTGATMVFGSASQAAMVFGLGDASMEEQATVVRIESDTVSKSSGYGTRTVSLPVLTFRHMGHSYELSPQAVSGDRHFTVGETVSVIFPPGEPEKALLREFLQESWMVPMILGLMLLTGVPFFAFGLWHLTFGES
ncbi:MAG: DUF3592 domain-containing protein [Acidobacteriota bacterium]